MDADLRGQYLHDQATRGEVLSAEEQLELQRWYAHEDDAETTALQGTVNDDPDTYLQHQVQITLDHLRVVTGQLQEVSAENEAVRREIAALQRRLATHASTRAA